LALTRPCHTMVITHSSLTGATSFPAPQPTSAGAYWAGGGRDA
jgi:hypothetical protein